MCALFIVVIVMAHRTLSLDPKLGSADLIGERRALFPGRPEARHVVNDDCVS